MAPNAQLKSPLLYQFAAKPHRQGLLVALAALAILTSACAQPQAEPIQLGYRVLEAAPHDTALFTQGLLVQGEYLVETSGGYGNSLIRRYRADNGTTAQQASFPDRVFAEGVAQAGDKLYVLTWKAGVCFVLDATTLQLQTTHNYSGDGWGLAHDGKQLIMSDGSDKLTWREPNSFKMIGELPVTGGKRSWKNLNELEYAEGLIWANIWQESLIAAIDPITGRVHGVLDLSALVKQNSHRPNHSVLNGIAYDAERDAYWVTGKLWPNRYLIEITSLESARGNRPKAPGS